MDVLIRCIPVGLRAVALMTAALSIFVSTEAEATSWSIRDLGTLSDSPDTFSIATDLNDSGQVVGYSLSPPHLHNGVDILSFAHAFISAPNGGPIVDLGPEPNDQSRANAINEAGRVVGENLSNGSFQTGLITGPDGTPVVADPSLLSSYSMTDINNADQILFYHTALGSVNVMQADGSTEQIARFGHPVAINDAGLVVYEDDIGTQAYLWDKDNGSRPLDGVSTVRNINNAGQIIGIANGSGFITAANGGALSLLGTLGGNFTDPMGINDLGQVVGLSQTSAGIFNAFVTDLHTGTLTNLEILPAIMQAGWSGLTVAAINNLGQIAGTGTINGQQHAFFLTPVPEPGTYALMLAGLSLLCMQARRRKALNILNQ